MIPTDSAPASSRSRRSVPGGQPPSWSQRAVGALLGAYKLCLSPFLPAACRYRPTCSEYTREAVERHGIARGLWLGARRICRCHPLRKGGFDPVP